jgi:outer membrane protein OmpA-like peptidoglycan-associated protein
LTDKETELLKKLAAKEVQLQKALVAKEMQFQQALVDSEAKTRQALVAKETQLQEVLAAKEAQRSSKLAREQAEYARALAGLKKQLQGKEAQLESLKQQGNRLASKHKALLGAQKKIDKELAGVRQAKQDKQKITDRLKALEKYGAMVTKFGEVILPLNATSFRRDDHVIQAPLQDFLRTIVPRYAKLLCGEPQYCAQIKEVKVGGHASPVYKGKYMSPEDESPLARYAQYYNLELSFKRAQAVFQFIKFDMFFPHKAEFMKKLTDVSGHGYLKAKSVPKLYVGKFAKCADEYNCEKERYVVLTFQMSLEEIH